MSINRANQEWPADVALDLSAVFSPLDSFTDRIIRKTDEASVNAIVELWEEGRH